MNKRICKLYKLLQNYSIKSSNDTNISQNRTVVKNLLK